MGMAVDETTGAIFYRKWHSEAFDDLTHLRFVEPILAVSTCRSSLAMLLTRCGGNRLINLL